MYSIQTESRILSIVLSAQSKVFAAVSNGIRWEGLWRMPWHPIRMRVDRPKVLNNLILIKCSLTFEQKIHSPPVYMEQKSSSSNCLRFPTKYKLWQCAAVPAIFRDPTGRYAGKLWRPKGGKFRHASRAMWRVDRIDREHRSRRMETFRTRFPYTTPETHQIESL